MSKVGVQEILQEVLLHSGCFGAICCRFICPVAKPFGGASFER